MIWLDGHIADPDRLSIGRADRLFEHGLGLFETFRTWAGRAPLLGRHLARLRHSASTLGIDLDPARLPTAADVASLTRSAGLPDALLRLTVTAGQAPDVPPLAWLAAGPLPPDPPTGGWTVVDAGWPVAVDDPLARHKTLNYWSKRIASDRARAAGADEAIFASADGRIWEGSRSNLFLVLGRDLVTPPRTGPILPGVMRDLVLERAEATGLNPREADVTAATVDQADEVFLTNSLRGPIPVHAWRGRSHRPADPTFPHSAKLRASIWHHLDTPSTAP